MLKLVSTPDFIHQYQVVRDDGLPDIMLSLFASELMKSLSPGSVPIYMREVLALFNWALSDSTVQRHQWKMLGPVVEVRNIIHEYLTVAAKCKLTYRADRSGVKATYVSETQETRINVRILLAALRRFYDHLISSKIYEPPNPLLHAEMGWVTQELRAQYRRAVREIEGRDPMPAVSGVDPPSGIRLSANFFRCVDREWVPKTIDDPDFPHLVYRAGKEYGWGLRELCVVRILFEGGGRISEVLDLTALDWFTSQFLNQFQARNKGSFGVRTKRFVVSSATAKLVRRYFDDDANGRRAHDPQGLCLADLGKMDAADLAKVRLFLTTRGGPVSPRMFRSDYWNPALGAAGIAAPPHIARHWFVTNALRTIERSATDQNDMVRRKAELVQYMAWTYSAYLREQQERVKIKTDAVQSKFYQIRHVAGIRCNQVRRLHEAAGHAIAAVEANDLRCPYEFSYEETAQTMGRRAVRQRVELTLWDSNSLREHAVALGYHEAPATTLQRRWQEASFSPKNRAYFVEYNATTSLTQGCPAEPFWFLDLFRHRVFRHLDVRSDSDLAERREAFHAKWGYESKSAWADGGLLAFGPTDFRPIDFLQQREGHEFLPYEGIYAACIFGGLVIRMGTITGARIGEIMQIAQSPDCFKQLENVGPKAATRWMLRLVPKGRQKREDYFIDEDTKRHLVELIRFQCEKWGDPLIPIVKIEDDKRAPDRYVLQWNGRGLRLHVLNTFMRFLLHGLILRSLDGNVVQLSSHLLRHSFATEMADLNTPVEVIAKLLHQRDPTVTKYYARPTPTKVMSAAEMIFVDRIDLGAEGRRSPDEIGRMLREAEGKVGALTEVFGGTCVVANMCPAKFVCVGCAGNAPDPAKRYQIAQKQAWAEQQLQYARREKLVAEERQMKQLIADCKLIKEEMELIEAMRKDAAQIVSVEHGSPR